MIYKLRHLIILFAVAATWGLPVLIAAEGPVAAKATKDKAFPPGWEATAQRDEIRPAFSFEPKGGPRENGAFVIIADESASQHGRFQKSFTVTGGKYYRFEAVRKSVNVEVPRRSTPARIVWQDKEGKSVPADPPTGREKEAGSIPLAEPEHPLDGETDEQGWTHVAGVYRAPTAAAQAIVELHLQWAPRGRAIWSSVSFAETPLPPSRKVRLATVHYIPSGKSPRANCEEYAPFIAEAAKQRADLVVLGETVPYVRVGKKPHETAEPIPGPTTEYFGKLAKAHSLHIVVSLYEREGKAVYNAAVLLGPNGTIIGKYRKVCLPHSEIEAGVTSGDDYPVFDTKFGKVGMMVCYDGFFPEVARELTNRGAEVIAWPVWGCNPLLAQARACENHVYLVSSTYTDVKSNWTLSAIYDHAGKPIAKGEEWGEIAVAEVDLSERHFWRNNLGDFHAMAQRHRPAPPKETHPAAVLVEAKTLAEKSASGEKERKEKRSVKTVAVMLFEGVELLDFAGPAEVFIIANKGKSYRVVTVAESTKPLKTMGGVTVTPDFTFENAPKADILVVPGGNTSAVGKAGREWLKTTSGGAEITMSVCYGAFLLADANLLDNMEATTHHWGIADLKAAAPRCRVVMGKRFVDSGRIITTAGVTAGVDGALHVVERLQGEEAAKWAAEEWMELAAKRRPTNRRLKAANASEGTLQSEEPGASTAH
jgi:predicted amidohydrolase/putative intracellular protease/amidase